MVNKGPSKACERCRQKNTKCDRVRPSCSQCQRQGIACPGYRDHGGVVFKDQSKAVADRHGRKVSTRVTPRDPVLIQSEIALDPKIIAMHFFISQHAPKNIREASLSRGHFDFLETLYRNSAPDSALALAAEALAVRSMRLLCDRNQDAARYLEIDDRPALSALRKALGDPKECLRDETLMAVLCFDYGEHLTSSKIGRLPSTFHTNGALMLIQHRNRNHIKSQISDYLVGAVRSNLVLQNFWRKSAEDQEAIDKFPNSEVVVGSPIMKLHRVLLGSIQVAKKMGHHRPTLTAAEVIEVATAQLPQFEEMDLALRKWLEEAPSVWGPFIGGLYDHGPFLSTPSADEGFPSPPEAYFCGQFLCVRMMILKFIFVSLVQSQQPHSVQGSTRQSILHAVARCIDRLMQVLIFLRVTGDYSRNHQGLEAERIHSMLHTDALNNDPNVILEARVHMLQLTRWAMSIMTWQIPGSADFKVDSAQIGPLAAIFREISTLMERVTLMGERN